jgi:hypothetical protein
MNKPLPIRDVRNGYTPTVAGPKQPPKGGSALPQTTARNPALPKK